LTERGVRSAATDFADGATGLERLMTQFEIPAGWTAQAYRFALDPTPTQVRELESHCGAARFAFNYMLAM
jgi:hypothetical protein